MARRKRKYKSKQKMFQCEKKYVIDSTDYRYRFVYISFLGCRINYPLASL